MPRFSQQRAENSHGQWLYLAAGTCATAGVQWLTVWMLARTAEPRLVGLYGLVLAWLVPLFAFCGLQLRPLLATENGGPARLAAYWQLRRWGIAAALALVGALAFAGSEQPGWPWIVLAAAIPRVAEMVSDFSYGMRTRRGAFRAIGASQMLRAAVSFNFFGLVWMLGASLPLALMAGGTGAMVITAWVDTAWGASAGATHPARGLQSDRGLGSGIQDRFAGSPERTAPVRPVLLVALPLAGVTFLNQAVVATPRVLMGHWRQLEEIAVLSCLMSLLVVPSLIASAYAAGLSPELAEAYCAEGPRGMWPIMVRALRGIFLVATPGVLVLLAFGDVGMRMLFGEAYGVDQAALSGAALFAVSWALSSVFGTAATAARRIWPQIASFLIALGVCMALGLQFIPQIGLAGATWSLGGAGLTLACLYLAEFSHARLQASGDHRPAGATLDSKGVITDA